MPRKVGEKAAMKSRSGDCTGCTKPFTAGQRMTAVSEGVSPNSEFKGWFCDECIRNFTPPVTGVEITERPGPLFTGDEQEKPE